MRSDDERRRFIERRDERHGLSEPAQEAEPDRPEVIQPEESGVNAGDKEETVEANKPAPQSEAPHAPEPEDERTPSTPRAPSVGTPASAGSELQEDPGEPRELLEKQKTTVNNRDE